MISKQADVQNTDNVRWSRDSNFETMNTTDSKKGFQTIVKGRTIYEYFRLKVEEQPASNHIYWLL